MDANRLRAACRQLDHAVDRPFGTALNPLRHLGALGVLLFCLIAASGLYLYVVLDTSAAGAYRSIERLAREQPHVGGLLRSLHRYAADAFVIVMLLHLLREWLFGRYSGFRRFSWLTGVPLIGFAFASALVGFWLNWDQLGQFSALATAEWLDALPLFATPLTHNFVGTGAIDDRLFSLFVFVHLGVPLMLLFGLWFHLQRISRPEVMPPRALALGTLAMLVALALVHPVTSQAPADPARVPQLLAYDWILLAIHPLADATSPAAVWALVLLSLGLLFALPFLPRRAAAVPVARVDPSNCNGCRRCFDDCPYAAVTMLPHPDAQKRRLGRELAQVDADLCASCGICVGACPSSTPFRSLAELVTGIDMPSEPIGALRRRLQQQLAALPGPRRIVVFGCARGARVEALAAPDVAALGLMCIGALPPSFVEYALRDGAGAVLVSGCRANGCEFRLGQRWTEQRLAGTREPRLRAAVPRTQVATAWADAGEEDRLHAALARLRAGLDAPEAVRHG